MLLSGAAAIMQQNEGMIEIDIAFKEIVFLDIGQLMFSTNFSFNYLLFTFCLQQLKEQIM